MVVVGLVFVVYVAVIPRGDWTAGVVTTVVRVPLVVKVSVLPVPETLSAERTALVVTIPVGVVQVPEAVVQNWIVHCFMAVEAEAVKAKSYCTPVCPDLESEMVILRLARVPALTF